jgi:hypothetical protein
MTGTEREALAHARERADLARMRFGNAFDAVMRRMTPERLGADAVGAASDRFEIALRNLFGKTRYWPLAAGLLLLGAATVTFWRPARTVGRYALQFAQLVWATRQIWRLKQ